MFVKHLLLSVILPFAGATLNTTHSSPDHAIIFHSVTDPSGEISLDKTAHTESRPTLTRGIFSRARAQSAGIRMAMGIRTAEDGAADSGMFSRAAHVSLDHMQGTPFTEMPPRGPTLPNLLLYVASGTTSALSALEELRYIEKATEKPIGEVFSAGSGASLAGSFVIAGLFTKNARGKYRSVDEVESLFRRNLGGLMRPQSCFLCIPPKHAFNKDRLITTLRRIFGDVRLSDVEKPIYIHVKERLSRAEYLFSSCRAKANGSHDYTLVDMIASAATTKGLYQSKSVTSLGNAHSSGTSRRFLDIVEHQGDSTSALPSVMAYTRDAKCDKDQIGVISLGHIDQSMAICAKSQQTLRDESLSEFALGKNHVRIAITFDPIPSDPFGTGNDTIRSLIQRSNPLNPGHHKFKEHFDKGMYRLGLATHEDIRRCASFVFVMTKDGVKRISRERYAFSQRQKPSFPARMGVDTDRVPVPKIIRTSSRASVADDLRTYGDSKGHEKKPDAQPARTADRSESDDSLSPAAVVADLTSEPGLSALPSVPASSIATKGTSKSHT